MENTSELVKINIDKRNNIHKEYRNMLLDLLKSNDRVGCVLPTGTGKSYGIIQNLCRLLDGNVLVLVNRLSLQDQYMAYNNSIIETKTYQSLLYINEDEYINIFSKYNYIICDEAHHICHQNKWGSCLDKISNLCNIKIIGLTATEERSDGINILNDFFCDGNTPPIYINDAIEMNILPEITYVTALTEIDEGVKTSIMNNLSQVERYRFEDILNIPNTLKEYINNERLDNLKVILFVSRLDYIEQAQNMCTQWFSEAFPDYNINIYTQNSTRSKLYNKEQLNTFIEKHNTKDIDILINVDMIGEGVHIKNVHTVIRFRHTKSMPKFIQEIGRCLNPYDDNGTYMKGLVFDFLNDINRIYSKPYREFAEEINGEYNDLGRHELIKINGKIKIIPKLIDFPEHIDKVIREVIGKGLLRWTISDDEELKKYYSEGKNEYDISKLNGRSVSANRHRLQRLGVYKVKYHLKDVDDEEIINYMKENNGKFIKKHYQDKFGINSRHLNKLAEENNIKFAQSINTVGSPEINRFKELLNNGLDTQHMYMDDIYDLLKVNKLDGNSRWRIAQYMKSNKIPFKVVSMKKYDIVYEYRKLGKTKEAINYLSKKYNVTASSIRQNIRKLKGISNNKLNKIIERGYV